ncbi:hypothetical protein CWS01_11680 [Niallia nealsonii]|uniref:Uncharacterized protein n=1 Tax=Niallia nealsonii TaxID=115979 RepID=A0A2N0Z2A5_9BACI|nr:hypothetical protein CWS01_11680 [Niallia nealsonii]
MLVFDDIWDNIHWCILKRSNAKKEFYSLMNIVVSDDIERFFADVDMPFEPREYIRKIADNYLEEGSR